MGFQAKRTDGRPQWRVVYDHVKDHATPGDVITYATLGGLLQTKKRTRVYATVSAANRRLWKSGQRSLQVVPLVGYRVLKPLEHEHQANGYQVQARRRLGNAVAVMHATDLNGMNPRERNWALQVTAGLTLMAREMDNHAAQLARHDDLIRQLQARIEDLEQT